MLQEKERRCSIVQKDNRNIQQLQSRYKRRKIATNDFRHCVLKSRSFDSMEQGYFNPSLYSQAILLQHFAKVMEYSDVSFANYTNIHDVIKESGELTELFEKECENRIINQFENELNFVYNDDGFLITELFYELAYEQVHPEISWIEKLVNKDTELFECLSFTISSLYHYCDWSMLTRYSTLDNFDEDNKEHNKHYKLVEETAETVQKEIDDSQLYANIQTQIGTAVALEVINKAIDKYRQCKLLQRFKFLYEYFIHSSHNLEDHITSYGGGGIEATDSYYMIWEENIVEDYSRAMTENYSMDVGSGSFHNIYTFNLETKDIDDVMHDNYVNYYIEFLKLITKLQKKYGPIV